MEHTEKTIFGVQWHPEAMAPQEDEAMKALFAYHIENARRFAKSQSDPSTDRDDRFPYRYPDDLSR